MNDDLFMTLMALGITYLAGKGLAEILIDFTKLLVVSYVGIIKWLTKKSIEIDDEELEKIKNILKETGQYGVFNYIREEYDLPETSNISIRLDRKVINYWEK